MTLGDANGGKMGKSLKAEQQKKRENQFLKNMYTDKMMLANVSLLPVKLWLVKEQPKQCNKNRRKKSKETFMYLTQHNRALINIDNKNKHI